MNLPPIIDAAKSKVPKLRLPPFIDAGDIGAGFVLLSLAGVAVLGASAVFGLAWAVFRLFGGL